MEGVITRSKSSRQKDDASKSKSHKSGSKSSVTSSSKRSETSSVLKARAAAREAKLQVEIEALRQKKLLELFLIRAFLFLIYCFVKKPK